MARGLNKVLLIGRLGHDPEMRYTPSGKPLTKFRMASDRTWTTAEGEKKTETEWFNIVSWGKLAEICNQYLKKGSKVLVEGRLTSDPATGGPRIWTSQDGNPRASFEINAGTVRFLSSRSEMDGGSQSASDDGEFFEPGDDDIPF